MITDKVLGDNCSRFTGNRNYDEKLMLLHNMIDLKVENELPKDSQTNLISIIPSLWNLKEKRCEHITHNE